MFPDNYKMISIEDRFVRWKNERSFLFVRGREKFFFPKKLMLDDYDGYLLCYPPGFEFKNPDTGVVYDPDFLHEHFNARRLRHRPEKYEVTEVTVDDSLTHD